MLNQPKDRYCFPTEFLNIVPCLRCIFKICIHRSSHHRDAVCLFFLTFSGNIGVPIKLLYEAEGMKVTAEVSEMGRDPAPNLS
jgi:hypothetical protein